MMLREPLRTLALRDENVAPVVEGHSYQPPLKASVNQPSIQNQPIKQQSKWTANAARIVLAPINTNTQTPIQSPVQQPATQIPPPVTTIAPAAPIIAPAIPASTHHTRSTLSELEERESIAKDEMTAVGQVCMAAWTAALEASRAYRRVRKEWRKAKMKLEKKRNITPVATEPVIELSQPIDVTQQEVEPQVDEDAPPAALFASPDADGLVDEVEEMEAAVHDVEQAEVEYAALTQAETQIEEEGEMEEEGEGQGEMVEEEGTTCETMDGTSAAVPTKFGVMSFSFGGKVRPNAARAPIVFNSKPTASDKARAAALKAKLEQDMREHEARRLALQEVQRQKSIEFDRRRLAAKEKMEEQLMKRTHGGKCEETERRRLEAEARRVKVHEEEKKAKIIGKEKKRKELEHTIGEMKAKEKAHANHKKTHSHTHTTTTTVQPTEPTTTSTEGVPTTTTGETNAP